MVFADYEAGRKSVLTFDFFAGETHVGSGQISPGVCADECVYPVCPAVDDLESEEVSIVLQSSAITFDVHNVGCFVCIGGDKHERVCP